MKILIIKSVFLISSIGWIVSCTFSPIGDNKFDCNRKDAPIEFCRSVRAVIVSTDADLPDTKYSKAFRMEDYDIANGLSDTKTQVSIPQNGTNRASSTLPHNANYGSAPMAGAPVRQAPVIQKVLIKPFVDENDILHEGQTTFKEIQSSKWTGFDRNNTVSNLSGGVNYPHRAKESRNVFMEHADNGTDNSASSTTEFTQPTSAAGNGATKPASSNGDNSMPN